MDFVNLSVDADDQRRKCHNRKSLAMVVFNKNNRCFSGESYSVEANETGKTNPIEEIQNACNMCNELDTLNMTLKRQVSGGLEGVNVVILH